MLKKIKIGIAGYGNLARGAESAIAQQKDMVLTSVFTRRDPDSIRTGTEGVTVLTMDALTKEKQMLDVLLLCGGSAFDLPEQTPLYAAHYNVVDSFDTHARIPEHFQTVDTAAKSAGKCALISCGWDPGLFSLNRLYASSILPDGADYTFWGKGVSQGHSDAIRRIRGVKDARQYAVPQERALDLARSGAEPMLTTREKHVRECFVVVTKESDTAEEKQRIEQEIKTMPNYFAEYDTTVTFITQEEMDRDHAGMPHGGSVIRTGATGRDRAHRHVIEYSLKLDSNPEFTGSVLVAYARAIARLNEEGKSGAMTVFDIAPAYLSPLSPEEMRAHLL